MEKIKFLVLFSIFRSAIGDSPRSIESYQQIISYVYKSFECDFIILFGNTLNRESLRSHFSQQDSQVIIAQKKITSNEIEKIGNARNPLVVFLDDFGNAKFQLDILAVHVSKTIFLFFVTNWTEAKDLFHQIYVPYKYKFLISRNNRTQKNQEIISQITLNIQRQKILELFLATWSKVDGIKLCGTILSNQVLRVGLKDNRPFSIIEIINNTIIFQGLVKEIVDIFMSSINFKLVYTLVTQIGLKENGTWNGGMGLLKNDSIDIFLNILVRSSERNEDFQYSLPVVDSKIAMFLKQPDYTFSWTNYFEPFDIIVWSVIGLITVMNSICFTFLENYRKIYTIRRLRKTKVTVIIDYVEYVLSTYGAMCGQGVKESNFIPSRILRLTISVTSLLTLSHYSVVFLNLITTPKLKLPISGFKDLSVHSDYEIGCCKAHEWTIFKQSKDEVMQKIFYERIIRQTSPPATADEGLERLCQNNKYAFIAHNVKVLSYSSPNCTPVLVEFLTSAQLALIFQSGSPYVEIFNKQLLKLYENGILKRIKRKYLPPPQKIQKLWEPIEENAIISITAVFFGFILLSLILLLLEVSYHRTMSKPVYESC